VGIVDEFKDIAYKYNTANPQSDIELKSPAMGMTVKVPIVDSFTSEANVYIDNQPIGIVTGMQPGDICIDKSTGNLIVGLDNGGPTFGPANPVILGGPESMRDLLDSIDASTSIDTRRVTTTTSYTASTRTVDLKDLNTKDLMFIKDKIEEGYSYIKIKNLDELKQAFIRLGCYISDSDISTLATVGVFKLECGKFAIINWGDKNCIG